MKMLLGLVSPGNKVSTPHFPQQRAFPPAFLLWTPSSAVLPAKHPLALLSSKAQPCLADAPDPSHAPAFTWLCEPTDARAGISLPGRRQPSGRALGMGSRAVCRGETRGGEGDVTSEHPPGCQRGGTGVPLPPRACVRADSSWAGIRTRGGGVCRGGLITP